MTKREDEVPALLEEVVEQLRRIATALERQVVAGGGKVGA